MKALQEAKKKQEEDEANIRVEDPLAVKLTSVPAQTTEADIIDQMKKFGKIESIYIPTQENGMGRSSKIAIVRYKSKEEATRAVEEREVNIEFSAVQIERAIQRQRQDRRDRGDRPPFQGGDRDRAFGGGDRGGFGGGDRQERDRDRAAFTRK